MAVIFEEENFSFDTKNQQDSVQQKEQKNKEYKSNRLLLVSFSFLCFLAMYILPKYMNPPQKEKIIYFEDITEARMRLIPIEDRDTFLNNLPMRTEAKP